MKMLMHSLPRWRLYKKNTENNYSVINRLICNSLPQQLPLSEMVVVDVEFIKRLSSSTSTYSLGFVSLTHFHLAKQFSLHMPAGYRFMEIYKLQQLWSCDQNNKSYRLSNFSSKRAEKVIRTKK